MTTTALSTKTFRRMTNLAPWQLTSELFWVRRERERAAAEVSSLRRAEDEAFKVAMLSPTAVDHHYNGLLFKLAHSRVVQARRRLADLNSRWFWLTADV